jgi:hypothetical protein
MSNHIEAIRRYAAGGKLLAEAVEGLSREHLFAYPVPGTWSIQQIVVHMCDSDLVGTDRMKRVIAEDVPLLVNYDENAWAKNLDYDRIDTQQAVQLFALNRAYMTSILERLPEEAFDRYGIHTQTGRKTLLDFVVNYAEHLDGHLVHLWKKRKMLQK